MANLKILFIVFCFILFGCATQSNPNPKKIELSANGKVLHLKWINRNLSKIEQGSFLPILDKDNSIYATDNDGDIIKLDSTDGSIIDKFSIDDNFVSGVASSTDMLYVTTKSAKLLAISKFKHQIEWSVQLSSLAIEPPQYGENKVVVKTNDALVSAYNAESGSLMWVFQRPIPILTLHTTNSMELNTGGDVILLGENSGKVAVINLNNGVPLFELAISMPNGATDIDKINDVTSRPILSDKTICASTYNGRLSCLDAVNGNILWSEPFSSYNQIVTDKQNVYALSVDGVVFAFDLHSGIKVWSIDQLQYRNIFSPVILGDFLVMGDVDGNIYAIDKTSGKLVDMIVTPLKGGLSYPINNDHRVIYQSSNGNVGAIYIH
jgi:outer membrane protein assembly factor BamB